MVLLQISDIWLTHFFPFVSLFSVQVAKKVFNGKPVMAASGELGHTPYLDQLMWCENTRVELF